MKLWLDAKREPDVNWVWAKTSHLAITLLKGGCVERISFAPDQRKMVNEVVNWMIANDVHPKRGIHKRTDGAKVSRPLLQMINKAAAL